MVPYVVEDRTSVGKRSFSINLRLIATTSNIADNTERIINFVDGNTQMKIDYSS